MLNLAEAVAWERDDTTAVQTSTDTWTYRDLRKAVDAATASLAAGQPGQRVALVGLAPGPLLAYFYACSSLGLGPWPVGSHATTESSDIYSVADPHYIVTPASVQPTDATSAPLSPEGTCLVLLTSGTTSGRRKVVQLSADGFDSTAAFMNQRMGLLPTAREAVLAPLDHAFALGRCHAVLRAGGHLLLPEAPNLLTWLFECLEHHGADAISAVPSVLSTVLLRMRDDLATYGTGIKWVQTGAMRFGFEMRDGLLDALPNANIYLHYGLTEAMRTTFYELRSNPTKLHSEGPAADGVEIAILDPDTDEPAPDGDGGRIAIRGRNLCLGYYGTTTWEDALVDRSVPVRLACVATARSKIQRRRSQEPLRICRTPRARCHVSRRCD